MSDTFLRFRDSVVLEKLRSKLCFVHIRQWKCEGVLHAGELILSSVAGNDVACDKTEFPDRVILKAD